MCHSIMHRKRGNVRHQVQHPVSFCPLLRIGRIQVVAWSVIIYQIRHYRPRFTEFQIAINQNRNSFQWIDLFKFGSLLLAFHQIEFLVIQFDIQLLLKIKIAWRGTDGNAKKRVGAIAEVEWRREKRTN